MLEKLKELQSQTQAFIENAAITQELEDNFRKDMEESRLLTLEEYNKRKRMVKIKESVSRLFSPLI